MSESPSQPNRKRLKAEYTTGVPPMNEERNHSHQESVRFRSLNENPNFCANNEEMLRDPSSVVCLQTKTGDEEDYFRAEDSTEISEEEESSVATDATDAKPESHTTDTTHENLQEENYNGNDSWIDDDDDDKETVILQDRNEMIGKQIVTETIKDEEEPWILPDGAAMIVKQMAAENIFLETVDVVLEESRTPINFKELYALFRAFPGIAHRTYTVAWDHDETRVLYPLAILCCLKPPLELVRFVYNIYPPALHHKESVKRTMPFHYACTFQASLDVIEWMIEIDPTLVKTPREDLMYPLHLAAYFKASYDVVHRLIQAWPEAVELQDSGAWSILHAAVSGQASLDIVRQLHSLKPSNILTLDDKRRTPLHLACWKKGNSEVVSFLLARAPQALNMEDEGAESPLFRAARNQSLQVLRILLPENPPLDELGASILHFAALDNSADVVAYLLERYPEMAMIRTRDRDRYTPLHGACHFDSPLENVKALVKHAPTTLLMVNGHGKTPLETAQQCGVSSALIEYLVEATLQQRKIQATTWGPVKNNHDNSYRILEDAANQISFSLGRSSDRYMDNI